MTQLIGRDANRVPTNGMLGTAAFVDADQLAVSTPQQIALNLKQDAAAAATLTGVQTLTNKTLTTPAINGPRSGTTWDIADRASIQPTLDLDFANQRYSVYDAAAGGLVRGVASLADILTYTGSARTYTDALGILRAQGSNTPRIEFDPVTGAGLGLSVWGARANLLPCSQEFDHAFWVAPSIPATVTANTSVAPDGTLTADTISSATAALARMKQGSVVTPTLNAVYCCSLFVKKDPAATHALRLIAAVEPVANLLTQVDLTIATGAVARTAGNGSFGVQEFPDYWRVWCNVTDTAGTNTTAAMQIYVSSTAVIASSVVWGAQLEAGSTASPYIPTVASAVTAPSDAASITGSNFSKWYRQNAGTFVVVYRTAETTGTAVPFCAGNPALSFGSSEAIYAAHDGSVSRVSMVVRDGGVSQVAANPTTPTLPNVQNSAALAYALNDFAISVLGTAVQTDALGTLPTPTEFSVGSAIAGWTGAASHVNGTIARILYFPCALPSSLQALSA